jgi:hypothetical protein
MGGTAAATPLHAAWASSHLAGALASGQQVLAVGPVGVEPAAPCRTALEDAHGGQQAYCPALYGLLVAVLRVGPGSSSPCVPLRLQLCCGRAARALAGHPTACWQPGWTRRSCSWELFSLVVPRKVKAPGRQKVGLAAWLGRACRACMGVCCSATVGWCKGRVAHQATQAAHQATALGVQPPCQAADPSTRCFALSCGRSGVYSS